MRASAAADALLHTVGDVALPVKSVVQTMLLLPARILSLKVGIHLLKL